MNNGNKKYNFDRIIDRYGTDSLKYDYAKTFGMPEGLLPPPPTSPFRARILISPV